MINRDSWAALTDTQKAQVEAGCSTNLVAALAEEAASQFDALQKLQAEWVQLHRWSPEMLSAFESAWDEGRCGVVREGP